MAPPVSGLAVGVPTTITRRPPRGHFAEPDGGHGAPRGRVAPLSCRGGPAEARGRSKGPGPRAGGWTGLPAGGSGTAGRSRTPRERDLAGIDRRGAHDRFPTDGAKPTEISAPASSTATLPYGMPPRGPPGRRSARWRPGPWPSEVRAGGLGRARSRGAMRGSWPGVAGRRAVSRPEVGAMSRAPASSRLTPPLPAGPSSWEAGQPARVRVVRPIRGRDRSAARRGAGGESRRAPQSSFLRNRATLTVRRSVAKAVRMSVWRQSASRPTPRRMMPRSTSRK